MDGRRLNCVAPRLSGNKVYDEEKGTRGHGGGGEGAERCGRRKGERIGWTGSRWDVKGSGFG